jgi:hypothetical protein
MPDKNRTSSLGFSADANASAKNSAFIAGQPAPVIAHGRYAPSTVIPDPPPPQVQHRLPSDRCAASRV